jgi:hypothetical protein
MIGAPCSNSIRHARCARLIDLGIDEPHKLRRVRVGVELFEELVYLCRPLSGDLAEIELGDVPRPEADHVLGRRPRRTDRLDRLADHPAGLALEPIASPGSVVVIEVLDHERLDWPRNLADLAQHVDARQRDLAGADHLLGALGQLEQPHARAHSRPRPAERLRRAVLAQPASEHRLERTRFLVGVQLPARD